MEHEQAIENLDGIYSAIFTPFDDQNQINLDILEKTIRFQLSRGLNGFFVGGTTGEGLLMNFDERVSLFRSVVQIVNAVPNLERSQIRIIAHVGHPNSDDAAKLAIEAAKSGVDWIGSIGPVFYGQTFEATLRHYRHIAAATELPFMIYTMGSEIQPERDKQLFEIPNVSAIKYTGSDFYSLQQLVRRCERKIACVSGMDEMFVAGQSMGCQAGIGSTYNFMPDKYVSMLNACRENDFHAAMQIQAEINQVIDFFCTFENWSYRKAFMRYIGLDCGACRPPFTPLEDNEYLGFAESLDNLNILERNSASLP